MIVQLIVSASEDPISSSIIYFLDGFSTIDQETGATVVKAQQHGSSDALPAHYSSHEAELAALIAALKIRTGEVITIYSDSAYVTTVHSSIMRRSRRGFLKSDSSPVMHRNLLEAIIKGLVLPQAVAVVKCTMHISGQGFVPQGNVLADQAAKDAARHTPSTVPSHSQSIPVLVALTASPPESEFKTTTANNTIYYTETAKLHLRELEEAAPSHEKQLWEDRGCIQSGDELVNKQLST
ncbi:hypothetical protein NDU88_002532 [Pleurodeles waltl]|uniref:RNase H type-1 domain-containing protein n=1 Tax=Pleurodeles waltl TaxID=8319 RepID=A0AAV7M694_PLEWA|nr:hypothetical protein NDU88_002532 [Pleurodeles waltl]